MQQYQMYLQLLHSDSVMVPSDQKSLDLMSFTKEGFTFAKRAAKCQYSSCKFELHCYVNLKRIIATQKS